MLNTSARTRAQKYADRRWWGQGVQVVGFAIHRPEFDIGNRTSFYSVAILHCDGTTSTRFVCVINTTDGRIDVYESAGQDLSPRAPRTRHHRLAERSAS